MKGKSQNNKRQVTSTALRQRMRVGLVAVIVLIAGAGSLIQLKTIWSHGRQARQVSQAGPGKKQSGAMSTTSLNANMPSKEYIYAGGRLLATEEPSASSCGSGLPAPGNFQATANSLTTVQLTWTPPLNPPNPIDHYEVWRMDNIGQGFSLKIANASLPSTDNTVVANTSYLFKVRAVDTAGCFSDFSTIDLATTVIFQENVATNVPIRASHLTELRTGINAVRALAGYSQFNWGDAPQPTETPTPGAWINKEQMQKLRDNLDPARSRLGLSQQSYTNNPITLGTTVFAAHVQQLRQGLQ